jgi:hypothetical protein
MSNYKVGAKNHFDLFFTAEFNVRKWFYGCYFKCKKISRDKILVIKTGESAIIKRFRVLA